MSSKQSASSDGHDHQGEDRSVHEPKSRIQPAASGAKASRRSHQGEDETNVPTSDQQQAFGCSEQYDQPLQNKDDADCSVKTMIAKHNQQLQEQKLQHQKLESANCLLHKDNTRLREQRAKLKEQRDAFQGKIDYLQKECEKLDHEHKYADNRYQYFLSRVIQPYAKSKGLRWDDQSKATIDVIMDPLSNDALEATSLRQQVQALQKELLAKVEKTQSMSDDQFSQDFRNLVALIKTLSRTIRPNEKVNIFDILGSPILLSNVAQEHWTGRAGKKCFFEAWVWSVLLDTVFKSPFAIFGHVSNELRDVWDKMFQTKSDKDWPCPSSVSEGWRCATMDRLLEIVEPSLITGGILQGDTDAMKDNVLQARFELLGIVGGSLKHIDSAINFALISQIVDKAFTLALQMSLQRARLQVTYPDVGANFNKDEMSVMPGEDGEDADEGVVSYVVNPGLTKWGDAHGKHFDQRYDIVPALVQLEPVSTKRESK